MVWSTETAAETAVITVTDTATMGKIYSRGEEAEDADVDANYYPCHSSHSVLSTLDSSAAMRGAHLALPDGFFLF